MRLTILARLRAALDNSFVRDVTKLAAGTLGGRLVAVAAMPFATRLYTPGDFTLLAVYVGLVSTIAVAASLRLEVAIPLAATDAEAAQLLALSLISVMGVGGGTLILALVAPQQIAVVLGKPELGRYLWLVSLGVMLAASYSALQFWATRARRFGSIARTRVTQSVMSASAILGMGWLGIAPLGLLLGNMFNLGAGGVRLGIETLTRDRAIFQSISWTNLRKCLQSHCRYPLYSMPESLANVAGLHVSMILVAALAGVEAGFLLLAMQVMMVPMTLLGSSISQVYLSRAAEEMRNERLASFTLQIMQRLVRIGVGPIVFVGLISPVVFPLVFGTEWRRSGEIVTLLVPWMAIQFVASPVSTVMYVTGRQRAMLVMTVIGLIQRMGGVLLANLFFPGSITEGLAIGCAAYYVSVLVWVTNAAGFKAGHYIALLRSSLHWSIPAGFIAGLIVRYLFRIYE